MPEPAGGVLHPVSERTPTLPAELEERLRKSEGERALISAAIEKHVRPGIVQNRVNQIEALELDVELNEMLSDQFNRIFAYFRPGYHPSFPLLFVDRRPFELAISLHTHEHDV